MKKKMILISLAVLCLSLFIGGTLAYFSAGEIATNVITAGNIDIELIETDAEGNPFKDVTGVMPGATIDKIVTVKNTGDNPCWVRIGIEKKITLAEGKEGRPDVDLLILDLDDENWTEKDGFYYYNEKLDAGEETSPLFNTVTFDTTMDNMYQGSTAEIVVDAQAVQYANNLEAAGWPAE